MTDHLRAACQFLIAMTIAEDDRSAAIDDIDSLTLAAEDLEELFGGHIEQCQILGVVALLRVVDIAVAHAAHASGMTRAAMVREVVDKVNILHSGGTEANR